MAKEQGKEAAVPPKYPSRFDGFKIVGGHFAAFSIRHQLVAEFLALLQPANSGPFNRADMDKGVRSAFVGLDEAEAFHRVEPFYGPSRHGQFLLVSETMCEVVPDGSSPSSGGSLAPELLGVIGHDAYSEESVRLWATGQLWQRIDKLKRGFDTHSR
jgi:hypothetical protein